eukprot:COSAG04_NODE_450_length_14158_cov_17.389573_11_plen_93_part_00
MPMASIDLQRTARMACFGTTATCYIHTWWGFLEPRAAAVFCPTAQRLQNTAFKVFCDQTFGAGCAHANSWLAYPQATRSFLSPWPGRTRARA